jgi:hypothetical protein
MSYIYAFLSEWFECEKMMQAETWRRYLALQRSIEAVTEPEENVVYVDFKGLREARERA